jgi:Ca2+-binding EF-hand superfamily protein
VKALAAVPVVLLVAVPIRASDDLAFPDGEQVCQLCVDVRNGGKAPEERWASFLDKLFAYFDRDGDGVLSPAEVKRVFPLPLLGGGQVAPDFAAMDANGDGKVTAAEFRAFYRAKGFAPSCVAVRSASSEVFALSDALFRHLDRNNDGKLSAEELRNAPALLKRLDEDEDEVLTAAELLGANRAPGRMKPAGMKQIADNPKPCPTLTIDIGRKSAQMAENEFFRLTADGSLLHVPGGVCSITIAKDDPAAGFRAAKAFYLAQFKAAAGDKPAPRSLFEDDPTTQVLAGLFDAADRDGDGKLTRAELEAFFDLIELGVGCQVLVIVTDRGRNLFDLFDTNGDGKLDLGELLRAGRTLPAELARDKPLERDTVPASYRLVVGRGPVGDSFGPVPFGETSKPRVPAAVARGPAWFRAMDKNGDGYVSAQEFIGPPELFARLDTNGDGRISVEEAEAAGP